eukprot:403341478
MQNKLQQLNDEEYQSKNPVQQLGLNPYATKNHSSQALNSQLPVILMDGVTSGINLPFQDRQFFEIKNVKNNQELVDKNTAKRQRLKQHKENKKSERLRLIKQNLNTEQNVKNLDDNQINLNQPRKNTYQSAQQIKKEEVIQQDNNEENMFDQDLLNMSKQKMLEEQDEDKKNLQNDQHDINELEQTAPIKKKRVVKKKRMVNINSSSKRKNTKIVQNNDKNLI